MVQEGNKEFEQKIEGELGNQSDDNNGESLKEQEQKQEQVDQEENEEQEGQVESEEMIKPITFLDLQDQLVIPTNLSTLDINQIISTFERNANFFRFSFCS